MKLTFLGTGSAFTVDDNFHSNMLLQNDAGQNLLIDCGSDARHSLHRLGYTHKDVNDVYVSHLHADHAGGLEWLGFTHKFDPHCHMPKLYISETLAENLWQHTLSGGMRSIKEYPSKLSTYFGVQVIPTKIKKFLWCNIEFELVKTIHIYDFHHLVPCYGLFFKANNKSVYITADTTFIPQALEKYYRSADIIFHDCETSATHSSVHAHYDDLKTLPKDIKQKIWLYHYNPGTLPNAQSEGFNGFARAGQVFDFAL